MGGRRLGRLAREILSGYLRVLRRAGTVLLLILAAGAAGLLVTGPLWLFSTRSRQGYSLFMAALLGTLALLLIGLRIRRGIRGHGGFLPLVRRRWLPLLKRVAVALLLLVLLYAALVLLAAGLPVPGILLAAVFLLVLGYALRAAGTRG